MVVLRKVWAETSEYVGDTVQSHFLLTVGQRPLSVCSSCTDTLRTNSQDGLETDAWLGPGSRCRRKVPPVSEPQR